MSGTRTGTNDVVWYVRGAGSVNDKEDGLLNEECRIIPSGNGRKSTTKESLRKELVE